MTSTTLDHARPTTGRRTLKGLLHRWPTVAGLLMAGFTALDATDGAELAPILAASGFIYLAVAALQRRATTWPVFFGAFAVIAATNVTDTNIDATWILLGLAALFAGYGLLRGAARPADGLPLQTAAMAGFGFIAALAVIVGGDLSAYLVAAGLLGHAAWDVWHHRTGKVVARSLAEFCFVLDTLVAVALVIIAIRG